jgi:hypothetical protein
MLDRFKQAICGKRDQHLLIICDSCFSGALLKKLEENRNLEELKTRNCSFSIQSLCGSGQEAMGFVFIPALIHKLIPQDSKLTSYFVPPSMILPQISSHSSVGSNSPADKTIFA